VEDCPRDRIGGKEMTEEPTDIPELVGLVSMYGVVVFLESFLKVVGPDSVELAKPLANQTVEVGIGSFLRATLDDHIAQLNLREPSALGYT